MAWFRRRKRFSLGRYQAPEIFDETPIDELVGEGVLIAASAVRLAVKNRIILGSVRDSLDYDENRNVAAVVSELLALAGEKESDAARIAVDGQAAQNRDGKPKHHADYRSADTATLKRREDVSARLAERLRELSEDSGYVRDLAVASHALAWEEFAASVEHKLEHSRMLQDNDEYLRDRDQRLAMLGIDLHDLAHSRGTGP